MAVSVVPDPPYVQPGTGAPAAPPYNVAHVETSTMAALLLLPLHLYTKPAGNYVYPA